MAAPTHGQVGSTGGARVRFDQFQNKWIPEDQFNAGERNRANVGSGLDQLKSGLSPEWYGLLSDLNKKAPAPGANTPEAMLQEMRLAMDKANAGNEDRYQQILGIMDQRIASNTASGATQKADAARTTESNIAAGDQSLRSRGLYNTTVTDSLHRTQQEGLARTSAAIDQGTEQTNLGLLGDKANAIFNKEERGPNLNDIANFMMMREQALSAGQGPNKGQQFFQVAAPIIGGLFGPIGSAVGQGVAKWDAAKQGTSSQGMRSNGASWADNFNQNNYASYDTTMDPAPAYTQSGDYGELANAYQNQYA